MKVEKDKVITIDYTLRNSEGEVLDSSQDEGPLAYLQGHGNLIPGLERELEGKVPGDEIKTVIPPADAYGEYNPYLVLKVNKSDFTEPEAVEEGLQFQAQIEDQIRILTVKSIEGDEVTVDANHPLAGEELHFDVKILDIRDASEEELEHGHVHEEGHEHHE